MKASVVDLANRLGSLSSDGLKGRAGALQSELNLLAGSMFAEELEACGEGMSSLSLEVSEEKCFDHHQKRWSEGSCAERMC